MSLLCVLRPGAVLQFLPLWAAFPCGLEGRKSRETAHHTTRPEHGEHSANPPSARTPTGSCLHYGIHTQWHRRGQETPQPHANREAAGQTLPCAQPWCLPSPRLWRHLVDGETKELHQPKVRNLRAPQQRLWKNSSWVLLRFSSYKTNRSAWPVPRKHVVHQALTPSQRVRVSQGQADTYALPGSRVCWAKVSQEGFWAQQSLVLHTQESQGQKRVKVAWEHASLYVPLPNHQLSQWWEVLYWAPNTSVQFSTPDSAPCVLLNHSGSS